MKKHNTNFLNYFSFLIKVLFFISISLAAISEENQIGLVSEINGDAIAINDNLDERDLSIFDPIFLNEEIFVTQNSSLVLQFNDNTSIIMKELTSLNVSEFENSKLNPQFRLKVSKGKIIVESGSMAKNKNGKMEVEIQTTSLGLRGTRLNLKIKDNEEFDMSLGKDNFGEIGQIKIISNGLPDIYSQETIFSIDQVYKVSSYKVDRREKSTEELDEVKLSNETFVNNSKINEDKIENQLISKLTNGKISDLNNDGKIDTLDVEELKNLILKKKKMKYNL